MINLDLFYISVAGIGGSVILLIVLFYIAWRSNRLKHATSYCFEGNISKILSSRSDLEDSSIYPGVRTFSYNELEKITNNFDNERELGDGGFGLVFYGKSLRTSFPVENYSYMMMFK